MKPVRLSISITVQGPVLVQSSASSSFGMDAAVCRLPAGPQKNKPYIPFSLLKGKLRDAWLELHSQSSDLFSREDLVMLFGKGGRGKINITGEEAHVLTGRLLPEDLVTHTPEGPENRDLRTKLRSFTAIDDKSGTASHQSLRVVEIPFPAGKKVLFEGGGWLFVSRDEDAQRLIFSLNKALAWVTQTGALRSIGFGLVLKSSIEAVETTQEFFPMDGATDALEVTLRPGGPLCVTSHHVGDNYFESGNMLPGNMIAGAIMETRRALGKSRPPKGFDQVRFGHARPCLANEHPAEEAPLSLVNTSEGIRDIALHKEPVLYGKNESSFMAPAFMTDWKSKHFDELNAAYTPALPVHETRVRTAINDVTRTADKGTGTRDGKLFALDVVHPYSADDRRLVWKARIDLGEVENSEDRIECANDLSEAISLLGFVSKTKAVCEGSVRFVEAFTPSEMENGEMVTLVLQTPAMLADPRFQDLKSVLSYGQISPREILLSYQAAFADLTDSMDLSHVYANQFLAGGDTLAHRFKKTEGYQPWLLTSPGSVFVFRITQADSAKKTVETWLNRGLPLPEWAKKQFGAKWNENPYIPQNGFGAVKKHTFHHKPPEQIKDVGSVL